MNFTREYPVDRSASADGLDIGAIAIFFIGVSSTVYVKIVEFTYISMMAVHLVPLGILALVVAHSPLFGMPTDMRRYLLYPSLLATYMVVRHSVDGLGYGFWFGLRSVVNTLIFALSLYLMSHNRSRHKYLLAGLVTGVLVSLAFAWLNIHVADHRVRLPQGRWLGLLPDANRFAGVLGLATIVCIGASLRSKAMPMKCIYVGVSVLCCAGVIMTGSRGGVASLAVAVFAISVARAARPTDLYRALGIGLLGIVVFWVSTKAIPEAFPSRVMDLAHVDEYDETYASSRRYYSIRMTWQFFLHNPFVGYGYEADRFENMSGSGETSPHNTYMQLLATSGLVGFLLYMPLPVGIGWRLLVASRGTRRGGRDPVAVDPLLVFGLFVALGAHGVVESLAQSTHAWLIFALGCSVDLWGRRSLSCGTNAGQPGNAGTAVSSFSTKHRLGGPSEKARLP